MSAEHGTESEFNRRRILQALGATGIASLAGCAGLGNGDDDDDEAIDPVQERVTVDPDEIDEGGTLRFSHVLSPDDWDPSESASAPATVIHNLFFEGLLTVNAGGEPFPWLAEDFELTEVQDIDEEDYVPYMREAPVVRPDEGAPFIDVDEQIVVRDPDNDLENDETARVLTVEETGDAVDDGVFGMEFNYDLREGIEFQNGEELTAENVVLSHEMQENALNAGQHFDQFLHAEAVDTYEVNMYAIFPDPEALVDIQPIGGIFPTEIAERELGERIDPLDGRPPIGSGPWEFVEYEDENFLIVERNDDYWLQDYGLENIDWWDGPDGFPEAPPIEEIDIEFIPEDSTRAATLEAGDADLTYGVTADQRTSFDNDEGFRVPRTSGGSYLFFQFPVTVPPMDDANVRRAVNHLIPRTDIVENIEQGWATEAWAPLPELAAADGTQDFEQLQEDLRPFNEFDPEEAERLIEESEYEPPIEVSIQTNADSEDRIRKVETIVEALNAQEAEDGTDLFDAEFETPGDLNTWFVEQLIQPGYEDEGHIAVVGLSGTFNPHSFCEAIHHPDSFRECCNWTIPPGTFPDYVELMDSAQRGVDVAEDPDLRRERYDQIWQQTVELNANSIIDFGLQTAVINNDIVGYNMYPFITGVLSYGLFSPVDEQVSYLDR